MAIQLKYVTKMTPNPILWLYIYVFLIVIDGHYCPSYFLTKTNVCTQMAVGQITHLKIKLSVNLKIRANGGIQPFSFPGYSIVISINKYTFYGLFLFYPEKTWIQQNGKFQQARILGYLKSRARSHYPWKFISHIGNQA